MENKKLFWREVNGVRKRKDCVCQIIKDVYGVILKVEAEVSILRGF